MTTLQQYDPDIHIPGVTQSKLGVTVMLFGQLGTWKTTWAAGWPSPIFFSIGAEGGDDALAVLPQFGIQPPANYQITSQEMFNNKLQLVINNYQNWGIKTIVFDSITFYVDMWIQELILKKNDMGKAPEMVMRDWGVLETHIIKEIAQRVHRTNLNVIWIAIEKQDVSRDMAGNSTIDRVYPWLQGASGIKLPAMCKMVIHADKEMVPDPQTGMMSVKPIYRTSPSLKCKIVRHKYGNAFPEGYLMDPEYGSWPTFRAIDSRIGQFIYR